jgi:hypothetical protein
MSDYRKDRSWSDQFIPSIKQIVGPYLLVPASLELDAHEATDLLVFKARDVRIAARMRAAEYAAQYPFDFTIRSSRDSGVETELSKIVSGWGDWLFYGFDGGARNVLPWWLLDLNVFRRALHFDLASETKKIRCTKKANGDGTHLAAYDILSFPRDLVVASSRSIQGAAA